MAGQLNKKEVMSMAISPDDKYKAAIAVNWLRRCSDGADNCAYCPFGDGIEDCTRDLHTTAADLLEKLAGLRK